MLWCTQADCQLARLGAKVYTSLGIAQSQYLGASWCLDGFWEAQASCGQEFPAREGQVIELFLHGAPSALAGCAAASLLHL